MQHRLGFTDAACNYPYAAPEPSCLAAADTINIQIPVEIRRLSGLNFAEMDCMRASWAAHICRIFAFRLFSFSCTRARERVSAEGTLIGPAAASLNPFIGRCGGRARMVPAAAFFA